MLLGLMTLFIGTLPKIFEPGNQERDLRMILKWIQEKKL
jgi:hypothetical protein